MKLTSRMWAVLGVATLFLLSGVALSVRTYQQVAITFSAQRHTHLVIEAAADFLSALKDAETGERGFVITGSEEFLQPYLAVREGMQRRLELLLKLTQADARSESLQELTPLVHANRDELVQVIELRRARASTEVLQWVASGRGKRLMDSIRTRMQAFADGQSDDLVHQEADHLAHLRKLLSLVVAASAMALATALGFAYLIYRQGRHRQNNLLHDETRQWLQKQVQLIPQRKIANQTQQRSEAQLAVPLNSIDHGVITNNALAHAAGLNPLAAQQKTHDSAVLTQTILNTVADGVLTLHGHSLVVETVNPAIEVMFGYAAADMIGRDIRLLIPMYSLRAGGATVAVEADATPPLPTEIPVREVQGYRKDGSVFTLEIALNEMWLDGERHYTGVLRDFTTRKLAEEAIFKEGALQAAIFNSANFSSIATDAKGVIQIFNVGAERMLGYAASDVVNQITPADISDPQEVIVRAKALSAELETSIAPGFEALVFKASRGIEDIYELTYIRKDGSRFPAVVSVTALRDDDEAIIGYLLIGTDNTARQQIEEERKKLDQRLRDQQFYTRSLIEANIDAIMTTDPVGIITDVNKQMESLTDCTRDELIGAPFKKYFTDPERAEAGIALVLNEKTVTNYELTARTRGGRETVVSYNATTFYDRDRNLRGVFAAARDVTERKRLDGVLEAKNVELEAARTLAEKANLAKSDFLSSMSHELRSPLNAILGFAQLMESETPSPSSVQQESISQILRAGWHLLKLINEILDLTIIESGQIPLSKEPVLLSAMLAECQGMFEPQAQQLGITMLFPVSDAGPFVLADQTRLKQVFINLMTNAIKYNRPRGTVEVLCALQPKARVRVSIRDTGLGLRLEQQAQLFQAFNRLGQEAGGVEGTGIGLVVAKQLVELMGGAIGVQSTVGEGSVFWFELDAVDGPVASHDDSRVRLIRSDVVRSARPSTLLYVEDNPANMKLVQKIIERYPDIRLLMASDGIAGVELARSALPDVILLDINLPGINGFETLRMLRADPLTASVPALAISANAMQSDIKKGQEAGFLRYLTKPIKVDELMQALNAALELSGRVRS